MRGRGAEPKSKTEREEREEIGEKNQHQLRTKVFSNVSQNSSDLLYNSWVPPLSKAILLDPSPGQPTGDQMHAKDAPSNPLFYAGAFMQLHVFNVNY